MPTAKRQNDQRAIGLLTASALLIVGSALSGAGVVFARHQGYRHAVLWLGFLTVTLWFGALMCIGLKFLQITEIRKRRRVSSSHISIDAEYVAEYCSRDRAAGLALTAFFGGLLVFLVLRSGRMPGIVICVGFFCFFAWYSVQLMVTRVTFTKEQIVARLPLFREVSEPYASVVGFRCKTGTLLLHFVDGKKLKLHSGLGEPEVVLAHLHSHCPEVPDMDAGREGRS